MSYCDKNTPETSKHFIKVCQNFTESRETLLDHIEVNFDPRFKKLSMKRQFEIIIYLYDHWAKTENPLLPGVTKLI